MCPIFFQNVIALKSSQPFTLKLGALSDYLSVHRGGHKILKGVNVVMGQFFNTVVKNK